MNLFHKKAQIQKLVMTPPTGTVQAAAEMMTERGVGSVLVMEGNRLLGIFTERDLLNRIISKGLDPKKIRLSEVMTRSVVTVDVNDSLEACYEKMQQTKARHLPIVDEGKVTGIVTMRDLLEWLWREIEEENAHLKRYLQQS